MSCKFKTVLYLLKAYLLQTSYNSANKDSEFRICQFQKKIPVFISENDHLLKWKILALFYFIALYNLEIA